MRLLRVEVEESRKRDEELDGVSLRSSDSDPFRLRLCLFDASLPPPPLACLTYGHEFYDFATSSVPFHPTLCYLVLLTRPPPTLYCKLSPQNPTASSPPHIRIEIKHHLPPYWNSAAFLLRLLCTTPFFVHGLHRLLSPNPNEPNPYRIVFYYLNRYVSYICITHPQNELRCSSLDEFTTLCHVIY
jgi:hypothetical protein